MEGNRAFQFDGSWVPSQIADDAKRLPRRPGSILQLHATVDGPGLAKSLDPLTEVLRSRLDSRDT